MRKIFLVIFTGLLLTLSPHSVKADSVAQLEPYSGAPLCFPGVYSGDQQCMAYGPSETLNEWAKNGLTYPIKGLPAYTLDEEITKMPYLFAKLNVNPENPVNTFPSLDAAVANDGPSGSLPPGATRWVAYNGSADVNGGHYVQLAESGEWLRASPAEYTRFRGLAFYRTPDNEFGWLVDIGNSRTGPGLNYPNTGKTYYRNTLVQVFAIAKANETDWFQIGINEWLERRYIRIVQINTTPPQGVIGNRWIEVNLLEQTLAVYDQSQLVYATMIATGVDPFFTKPGLFQIQVKKDTETMTGSFTSDKSDYYSFEKVPWTMYFDGARALHAAYWRTLFGYAQSHGCVNLSPGDSHWLYDWANVGDWVYVWDPSGKTPTDPAKYTQGGA